MIPASNAVVHSESTLSWQQEIAQSLRTPDELLNYLQLPAESIHEITGGHRQFPIRVTESYLRRIKPGEPNDPLLRQILPTVEELELAPGYGVDPVGDCTALRGNGILQKYHGRVLLITTPSCGIHCRYCFRRHYPYREHSLSSSSISEACGWIASDPTIHEVILSGGDPLMVSNQRLALLLNALESIPQLETIRLHTRMPIIAPSRLDVILVERLLRSPLNIVMVLHSNHPNELDHHVERSLKPVAGSGIILLNQSVLLKGVNDQTDTLEALSHRLFECGVLPYYLHMVDRVQGSHHFEVTEDRASQLISKLGSRLPGYLVPRLVREIEGEPRKTPI